MKSRLIPVLIFLAVPAMPFVFAQEERSKFDVTEPDNLNLRWVWAEVVSVDSKNCSLDVKFMNYGTNKEERLSIVLDKDTKFKNASSLDGIKTGDFVSIDYLIEDNKNVATQVIAEKP